MIFVDELNRGLDILVRPRSATFRIMNVKQSFAFYYKFSFIPLLVILLVSYLFGDSLLALFQNITSIWTILGIIIAIIWVAIPVFIIVNSILYFVFGRLLKTLEGGFDRTLAAVVYAQGPFVLFFWLTGFPNIGIYVAALLALWSLVVLVFGLAEQHGINMKKSALTVIVVVIVELVIVAAALYATGLLKVLA